MSYPVTFEADYVERRSRLSAFFRLILAIPLLIWGWFYGIAACIAIVIAWFAILITGRYPKGLYDFVAGFLRFVARVPHTRRCCVTRIPRSAAVPIPPTPCGWSSLGRWSATAA